jgi:hypothetical protein
MLQRAFQIFTNLRVSHFGSFAVGSSACGFLKQKMFLGFFWGAASQTCMPAPPSDKMISPANKTIEVRAKHFGRARRRSRPLDKLNLTSEILQKFSMLIADHGLGAMAQGAIAFTRMVSAASSCAQATVRSRTASDATP